MKIWGIGILIALATILNGCAVNKPVVSPSPIIGQIVTGLKNDTASLTQTTSTIKNNVAAGQNASTDPGTKTTLQPYWVNILMAAGVQDAIVKDLQAEVTNATIAKTQSDKLTTDYSTLQTQYAQLKTENASIYHTVSIITFGLGLLAIAAGVVLSLEGFLPGKIIGIAGAVLSIVSLAFGVITNVLNEINIYVLFGVLVVTVGGVIWYLIKHRTITAAAIATTVAVTAENVKLKTDHTNLMMKHEALKETLTSLHGKLIDAYVKLTSHTNLN